MRNVTVRQLQVFAEAADSLSLARVAERLHLTPSAVSFQIKRIESQVGFALFERIGKHARLTEAGQVLLGYARLVLRSLRDADEAMTALKGVTGGRVRLGLVSTAKYIVPHMIARFRAEAPGVRVLLSEGNRREVLAMVTGGDVDLAITGQPPDEADVVATRFAPHPSLIVASAGHALVGAARLDPGVLASEWFISREEGSGTRLLADAFFRDAGFMPRFAMESSSNEMIKQAVIAGMGLALISQHTIGLELSLNLLVPLAVEGFPLMRSWFVTHRRSLPLLPVQDRLRRFLIDNGQPIIEEIGRAHAVRSYPGD
jgi:LysR family transcriptional regulator, low CO2-responsive transcriptional regulator